ncbi:MAG TPA: DUF1990 family protein [Gemmataceae bacterium]|nr:DUF1990 family protein [Gemmataceae bacterium]
MQWLFGRSVGNVDLTSWHQRPYTPGVELGPRPHDNRDNHERVVAQERPGPPQAIARRLADAILRFDVFPPTLATPIVARTPVEVGDVVGLRYRFVPGIDLVFAARVYDRFDEVVGDQWRCGFRYRTLVGHPECGEETFTVEKNLTTGAITVALRSWSRPESWLARIAYPIVRRLQLQAGRSALGHLQTLI